MRNKKKSVVVFVALACCFFSCSNAQVKITLSSGNKANYQIYISNDTGVESKAAKVLQGYLFKISDADFTVTTSRGSRQIIITDVKNARQLFPDLRFGNPGEGGVLIRMVNYNLLIVGADDQGIMNAVYEFLEKFLGCRYYAEDAVYIPKINQVSIPGKIQYKYAPVIKYRFINYNEAFKGSYAEWNKLTNQPGNPNNLKMPEWGLWVHSMFTLVPPEKYFKDHPEYYALRNGKRTQTQLCLTNPDVLKIASESLAGIIQQNPQAEFFSVSQMDNNGFCQCDNCQRIAKEEQSQSGPYVNFVNQVAAGFPDKIISTLAYNFSRKVPQNIKPASNVNIFFCATGHNRCVPFISVTGPGSVYADLMDWKKKTNNIFFWDYLTDFRHLLLPFPNYHVLKPNIQFLADNNIPYTFQQGWAFAGSEMSELRCYLLAKLLWDPAINIDSTQQGFLDFYYGPAGKWIGEYLHSLTSYVQNNKVELTNSDAPLDHADDFLSAEQLNKYKQFFANAENEVKNDSIYFKRVQIAEQSIRYAVLEGESKEDTSAKNVNYYLSMLNDFKRVAKEAKVNRVAEGNVTVDSFYNENTTYQKTKRIKHLALGAAAKITDPSGYSPGVSLNALFDGMKGDKTTDKKWVPFEKPFIELIVDLKKTISFDTILMNFIHDPAHLALLPESITFAVSNDNTNFTNIGIVKNSWANLGLKKEIKTFRLAAASKNTARYIKINIKMINSSSYIINDKPPVMLCDEIIVL